MTDTNKKLAKLAEETKTDDTFENLDKLEKDLGLDKEDKDDDRKKTLVEKVVEDTPAAAASELLNNQEPY